MIVLPDGAPCNAKSQREIQLDSACRTGHHGLMLIYKIFRTDEWADLQKYGSSDGAPVDRSDGFVHFSTAEQAAETAAKHFAGIEGLTLLACETDAMGDDLKWEVSRGSALFPHLYRQIRMSDVVWSRALPIHGQTHQFPEEMA